MSNHKQTFDKHLQRFLFCVLLAAYLLVYVPQPREIDGRAMLAVTVSTLRYGSADIGSIGAEDALVPPIGRMGSFGVDGAYYAKKGPTPSLFFVPFVVLADALPDLPTRATVMLFNPLVLALTGVLLYRFIRQLGFRPITTCCCALIFGLGTFALPYSKTLFGEPLAGLLLLIALSFGQQYRLYSQRYAALIVGTALGLAVGINLSYGAMIPIVAGYLLLRPHAPLAEAHERTRQGMLRLDVYAFTLFAAGLLLSLALIAAYNWARFGSPLASGYQFGQGEAFDRSILVGLYGLFFSPFRGLFWYSPVLLLAIPGGLMLRRSHSGLLGVILLMTAAQAVIYAAWWSWHGGIVWGPRFLLPITPLLVVLLAPLVEAGFKRVPDRPFARGSEDAGGTSLWLLRFALIALTLLSVGIGLLGALYSVDPHIGYLYACCGTGDAGGLISGLQDEVLTSAAHSAIIGHLALLVGGWTLEPAWLTNGIDWIHLFAAISVLAAGILSFTIRKNVRFFGLVTLVMMMLALYVVAARQTADKAQIQTLQETLQPRGVMLAASTFYGDRLIDLEGGLRPLTMNAPTTPDDPLAAGMWAYALEQAHASHGLLWFVTWFPPQDGQNWQEYALWQTAGFGGERAIPGHRALLFDLSPMPAADQAGGWQFGDIQLARYGLAFAEDGLRVTVEWTAAAAPEAAYSWFIHLLDANGQIVAQQDRQPLGGYTPTDQWAAGETVTDRLFFPLADGTDTAGWALRIGWLDAVGERLAVTTADGQRVEEGFVVLAVGS